jgi:TadE-like protein
MMRRFRQIFHRWRRLVGCRRGVMAIEFAFTAPIAIAALAGVMELSMIMFVNTLLEGSVREASRFGITGYIPEGVNREDVIRDVVADNTIGLVDMENTQIIYQVYSSFGDIGKPEPFVDDPPENGIYDEGESYTDVNGNGQWDADMGVAGLGGPGDVVLYRIITQWTVMTPLFVPLMGDNGAMTLSASVAVRNEPYNTDPPPVGP